LHCPGNVSTPVAYLCYIHGIGRSQYCIILKGYGNSHGTFHDKPEDPSDFSIKAIILKAPVFKASRGHQNFKE
jgi:hypothetical protein